MNTEEKKAVREALQMADDFLMDLDKNDHQYRLELAGYTKQALAILDKSEGRADSVVAKCPECFGDKVIQGSDGSNRPRPCEYCSDTPTQSATDDKMEVFAGKPALEHAYEYTTELYKSLRDRFYGLEETKRKALVGVMLKAGYQVGSETSWGDLLIALDHPSATAELVEAILKESGGKEGGEIHAPTHSLLRLRAKALASLEEGEAMSKCTHSKSSCDDCDYELKLEGALAYRAWIEQKASYVGLEKAWEYLPEGVDLD